MLGLTIWLVLSTMLCVECDLLSTGQLMKFYVTYRSDVNVVKVSVLWCGW